MKGTAINLMVLLLFRLGIRRKKLIYSKNGNNQAVWENFFKSVVKSKNSR